MRLTRPRSLVPGTPPSPGGAFVQAKSASTGATEQSSLTVTLDSLATAGNLIVIGANSDATLTLPSGFSTAASKVQSNAGYIWYKVADGSEQALTCTPSVAREVVMVAAEYTGPLSSPLDQTVTQSSAGSTGTGPVGPGTTASPTTQAAELVVAMVGPHSFTAGAPPNTPVWANSYTNRGTAATSFTTSTRNCAIFLADLLVAATGTQGTTVTWTASANDYAAVLATFKLTG